MVADECISCLGRTVEHCGKARSQRARRARRKDHPEALDQKTRDASNEDGADDDDDDDDSNSVLPRKRQPSD